MAAQFFNDSNALVNTLLGGWQISAINTMQAGTPFNVGYSPNSANAVSPQIGATYRGANEYRLNIVAGQPIIKKTKLSSGFIQYTNLAAFTLPATKDASGNLLSPLVMHRAILAILLLSIRRSCSQQEVQHTDRKPEGGVSFRGIQHLRPH